MTRRYLFKILLGCVAAPFAALAAPGVPLTYSPTITIDASSKKAFEQLLLKERKHIVAAVAGQLAREMEIK